ncbi:MAG: OHCU decarboxylase [Acidobacteria bacterium]|nr:MAG: OHCU decarboxylase [Acidobacteriota bacterium]
MGSDLSRRSFARGAVASGLLSLASGGRADQRTPLDDVNRMDETAFVRTFGPVYELSPWVAQAAFIKRPFATVTALHQALADAFAGGGTARQIKFFHDLSDLGDKSAPSGAVSDQSRAEQALSGVASLEATDQALLMALNKAYRAKFDIAFTICVRRNSPARIFSEFMRRMDNSVETELAISLQEQFYITRLRIAEMVSGPGMPVVYGDVSAHVLNSVIGAPAEGVAVELHQLWGARSRKVGAAVTNTDGRATLLSALPLPIGRYELRFGIGDYFRKTRTIGGGEKPFLDIVPMRIFIAKPEDSYHFPLIAAPHGYSIHG